MQKGKENEASLALASTSQEGDQGEDVEEMSAYERVMMRSRMQGEGLNHFFGSVMAKRAGHITDQPAHAPNPEAEQSTPVVSEDKVKSNEEGGEVVEEEEVRREEITRVPRSTEEIQGVNDFLGNAWEKRLKEMGHGPGRGSPYAMLRVGKGKERQEGTAPPEASTSQNVRRETEEALEGLAPLQESHLPINALPSSPSFSFSVPTSRQNSRPGSASGSTTRNTRLRKLFRRGHDRSKSLLASQTISLNDSECATPSGSKTERTRTRRISFRSLSEALLREVRNGKGKSYKTDLRPGARSAVINDQDGEGEITHNSIGLADSNASPLATKDDLVVINGAQINRSAMNGSQSAIPPLQLRELIHQSNRPSLLRASQSTPLSTEINLAPAGGITFNVSPFESSCPLTCVEQEETTTKGNLFDLMLPREIRIKCFRWLAILHEEEEEEEMCSRSTDGLKTYYGKEASTREMVRLTRVSRTWQSLLLDGQLWSTVDCSLLCNIPNTALYRLIRSAGPFIKELDLQSTPLLSSSLLVAMSIPHDSDEGKSGSKKAIRTPSLSTVRSITFMSLTRLNLKGCREITTTALHGVLVRLPSLCDLNVANTIAATNDTCLLLGSCLPNLKCLDFSRCLHVTGKGLVSFIQAGQGALYDKALFDSTSKALVKQEDIALPLRELRVTACRDISPTTMEHIGKALRSLEMIDLSYCRDLNDEAIKALVSHPGLRECDAAVAKTTFQKLATLQQSVSGPFVTLTPRQAGGNVETDEAHHRRLLPFLRHMSLSSCSRLTDKSCISLAHAVPNLLCLELANIGEDLHDEGLIKLFETTPQIQKIDLEGASEVSGKVLECLTPDVAYIESIGEMQYNRRKGRGSRSLRRLRNEPNEARSEKETHRTNSKKRRPLPTGAHLTHLVLSHLLKPEATVLYNLIRRCPRLTHLQLDDTKANDELLKEFVTLSRQRQMKGAYISVLDCTALSRNSNSYLLAHNTIRPRDGRRGRAFRELEYVGDGSNNRGGGEGRDEHHHNNVVDETNEDLVVVKTFFNWEIRSQQRRIQKRREQRTKRNADAKNRFMTRSRRNSWSAALSFMGGSGNQEEEEEEDRNGRWGRMTSSIVGDESEDARGCTLM
ncbi:hypothetical protein CBS101457_004159 [Exobasidium rhododendri]|nr:hypothetical protein CBS101457_004159 [Exobasidium rhododendri]